MGANLKKRGMRVDTTCKQCGEEAENIEHLFFHYSKAKILWKLSPVTWDGLSNQTRSFKDWWEAHDKAGNKNDLQNRHELTEHILWRMWKARNA